MILPEFLRENAFASPFARFMGPKQRAVDLKCSLMQHRLKLRHSEAATRTIRPTGVWSSVVAVNPAVIDPVPLPQKTHQPRNRAYLRRCWARLVKIAHTYPHRILVGPVARRLAVGPRPLLPPPKRDRLCVRLGQFVRHGRLVSASDHVHPIAPSVIFDYVHVRTHKQ